MDRLEGGRRNRTAPSLNWS